MEDEVLIYDTVSDKAYCLNATLAKVFNACDGKQTLDDLKRSYQFTDDLLFLALDKLKNKNLLADDDSYQSPFAGMSRREAVCRVGVGTMIAPNAAGCFDSGANTAVCGGGTTERSCAQACAPFAPSCCSCTVEFATDRRPDFQDCYCACQ